MSNDLVQRPLTGEDAAVSRLKSSCGTALTISQSTSGEWILAPSSDLRPEQLRHGLAGLDDALKGGPQDRIRNAIVELLGACDRPPSIDEESAAARTIALLQMAWEYPIDVIENACREWRRIPNYGRWWPAEQDLRAQCEKLVKARRDLRDQASHLLRAMESHERAGGGERGPIPRGSTLAFVMAVEETHGRDFVKSWLSSRSCAFTDDTIYTIGLAVERLQQRCSGYLEKYGVKVKKCMEVTREFYEDVDRSGVRFEAKPRKKKAWKEDRA